MRWFLVPLMVVVAGLPGTGVSRAAAVQGAPDQVGTPSAVVLVERLTTDEALEATGALRPEVAGFVSTLPVHQPLASRVLSLAAGRRVTTRSTCRRGTSRSVAAVTTPKRP